MLPSWVAEKALPKEPPRGGGSGFIARMLAQSGRFVEQAVFAEQVARRPGFLQRTDARTKLISVVGLTVAAAFLHHLPPLWFVGAFALAAGTLSRVRPTELFNRAWWVLPGTFVLVAAPAILNVITPGDTILTLLHFGEGARLGPIQLPADLTVTRQGVASAGLVVTRIWVGVLLAVTLTLTTRWQDLLKAAGTSATAPFVLILAMMYRYVFVLLRLVDEMHLAKRARTIAPGSLAAERRWVGGRVGALFVRSRRLTEQVYAAMVARGYTGEPKALAHSHFGWREAAWALGCVCVMAVALLGDRVALAGLRW